jgi:hypothetical protein
MFCLGFAFSFLGMNAQAEICHEHIFFFFLKSNCNIFLKVHPQSQRPVYVFDASVIGTLNTRGWLRGGPKKIIQA